MIENKPTIVVNNTVVANHWTYLDYDEYHRPTFYNPYTEAFTVRYFYDNAYRTVYVPAGARISISVAVVGIFPFTAQQWHKIPDPTLARIGCACHAPRSRSPPAEARHTGG